MTSDNYLFLSLSIKEVLTSKIFPQCSEWVSLHPHSRWFFVPSTIDRFFEMGLPVVGHEPDVGFRFYVSFQTFDECHRTLAPAHRSHNIAPPALASARFASCLQIILCFWRFVRQEQVCRAERQRNKDAA